MKKLCSLVAFAFCFVSLSFLTGCEDDKGEGHGAPAFYEAMEYNSQNGIYEWKIFDELSKIVMDTILVKIEGGVPPYRFYATDVSVVTLDEYDPDEKGGDFIYFLARKAGKSIVEVTDSKGTKSQTEVSVHSFSADFRVVKHILHLDVEDFEMEEEGFKDFLERTLSGRFFPLGGILNLTYIRTTGGEFAFRTETEKIIEGTFISSIYNKQGGFAEEYILQYDDSSATWHIDFSVPDEFKENPDQSYLPYVEDLTDEIKKQYPKAVINAIRLITLWEQLGNSND